MTKNNSKNWKTIEEEFRKKFGVVILATDTDDFIENPYNTDDVLKFFKPYFQEKMHEISLRELEEEHPLYRKEYNELPEIVDNNPKE